MTVEQDVRNFLLLSVATSMCSSSFTFVGPMRPAKGGFPEEAVTIKSYGGLNPNGFIAGDSRRTERRSDVQIRVRGRINDYIGASNRAHAIWHCLNRPSVSSFSTGSTQYISIIPYQSDPIFIGENDKEQPEFSINIRLHSIQP